MLLLRVVSVYLLVPLCPSGCCVSRQILSCSDHPPLTLVIFRASRKYLPLKNVNRNEKNLCRQKYPPIIKRIKKGIEFNMLLLWGGRGTFVVSKGSMYFDFGGVSTFWGAVFGGEDFNRFFYVRGTVLGSFKMRVLRNHSGVWIFARCKGFFSRDSPNIVYLFVRDGFLSAYLHFTLEGFFFVLFPSLRRNQRYRRY